VSPRQVIHFIDESAAHSRRAFFLVLPMNVHQFGKLAQIAGQQRVPAFVTQLLGKMQIVQHLAGIVAGSRVLIAQDFCAERDAPVKNSSKLSSRFAKVSEAIFKGSASTRSSGRNSKTGDATKCRDVLILLADRFFQQINLDVTGLLRQFLRGHKVSFHSMQRAQQCRGEAPRGSQPRSGRNIRQADNLKIWPHNSGQF